MFYHEYAQKKKKKKKRATFSTNPDTEMTGALANALSNLDVSPLPTSALLCRPTAATLALQGSRRFGRAKRRTYLDFSPA